MFVEGTYVGVPTCQAETLEVKLPSSDVLKPGNTVRTTDPAEALESAGFAESGIAPEPLADRAA